MQRREKCKRSYWDLKGGDVDGSHLTTNRYKKCKEVPVDGTYGAHEEEGAMPEDCWRSRGGGGCGGCLDDEDDGVASEEHLADEAFLVLSLLLRLPFAFLRLLRT